jgi:hypothetical protein
MEHLLLVLIDDEERVHALTRLRDAGFHIKTACSTDEAVAQLSVKHGPFSAVLVITENGSAFSDAVSRIRLFDPALPIIEAGGIEPTSAIVEQVVTAVRR